MTISQIAKGIRMGSLSSRQLVGRYIANIAAQRHLNAVIEINPDAIAIAERLDAADEKRGALYGVPILIKDNISTGDRMHTSAGSISLAENNAPKDAPIVCLLREAGAVILGKTNMTEFANYMSTSMANGYSSRGGQTLNFFDQNADPSGSSTGSAVAVAADLCAAAIGTETCGSIISPAQEAGIVGLKPTAGLIDAQGVIPISFTLDTPGSLTQCIEDTRLLLGVLAGKQYAKASVQTGLAALRVGIYHNADGGANVERASASERLIRAMREFGADIAEIPECSINTGFVGPLMQHEFQYGINQYLQSMNNRAIPQNLREIILFNERHADIALKYGQDMLALALHGDRNSQEYHEALAARDSAIRLLDAVFDENGVDICFMPSPDFGLTAGAGFPSMTVPIGKTSEGLPIGSFFVARRFCEDVLLHIGNEIENIMKLVQKSVFMGASMKQGNGN